MEEGQEIDMDLQASFKAGQYLTITGQQYNLCTQNQNINLLVTSNRYGYIFYATENDGLAVIPSKYIDQESRHLTKSSEDDDDNDDKQNEKLGEDSIVYRSYIPGLQKDAPINPYWIALNADDTVLAVILHQLDKQAWFIILYDVVKLIQIPDSTPVCPPIRLPADSIGGTIQHFTWNPAIPNIFAFIDGQGIVSTYEFDVNSKQLKNLGRSDQNDDRSSICWSPKGKQIVVVKYDGALDLYEPNMNLKKQYPPAVHNDTFPPCISVLWISTSQFLLGFSEDSPDENGYFHVLVTYDKDQPPKTVIYNDLFFDASGTANEVNAQYFYTRVNESKIIISALSKSLKINILGSKELNQDSLDIWSLADHNRATGKGLTNVNSNERPIITGMALGLNSTLQISEGKKKLPPYPMLLVSNSQGFLLVYYFIYGNLSSICRPPDQLPQVQIAQKQPVPLLNSSSETKAPLSNTFPSLSSGLNGFSFGPTSTITTQGSGTTNNNPFPFPFATQSSSGTTNTNSTPFNFNNPSVPITTKPSTVPQSTPMASIAPSGPAPPLSLKTTTMTTSQESSSLVSDSKKLIQTINDFQSKLNVARKPLSKPSSEPSVNSNESIDNLTRTLREMTTSLQSSIQSLKSLTSEHIQSMTKIENAHHQLKLSQTENLYQALRDRELDPWTQTRLDLIKTKYDQIKNQFNVLLQLTHTTIHDRSLTNDGGGDDENENEDFLPDLEISLNANETMKQRLRKRMMDLSHKVTETENELDNLCKQFDKSNLVSNETFIKSNSQSTIIDRPFHATDGEIFAHLEATHKKVRQIQVPQSPMINLSTIIEQNSSETNKSIPSIISIQQPSTPQQQQQQMNSPTIDSDSFKNMLRIVKTSIDLFSGVTSPEQLQELSNTIATSPLSSTSTQKPTVTSMNKTPTIPKQTTIAATNVTKPPTSIMKSMNTANILQTPARSVTPTISVTPATPAVSSDTTTKSQPTRTAVDLSKTSSSSTTGDNAIRSLLNNTLVSTPTNMTTIPNQTIRQTSTAPIISQPTTAPPLVSTPSTSTAFGVSVTPAATVTTSVQSTSPTTKPIQPTGFGARPTLSGNGFNLTPTTSIATSFGSATTTSTSTPFGSGFNVATTTAPTTSAASSAGSPFTAAATISTAAAPFGSGFGVTTTTTTPTTSAASPAPGPFGAAATTTTASAPATGLFGTVTTAATSAPSTDLFGTATTTTAPSSLFGAGFGSPPTSTATTSAPATGMFGTTPAPSTGLFGTTTTASSSPFGANFGGALTATATTSAPPTGLFGTATTTASSPFGSSFGGGGGAATTSSPFGISFSTSTSAPNTTPFGVPTSSATSGGFGAPPTIGATSTANTGMFGGAAFGSTATSPATSTANTGMFGGGGGTTGTFGSGFKGFGTQPAAAGPISTAFSFGGFGGQSSDSNPTPAGFGSFGSPTSGATQQQPSSPFSSAFGGAAPGQTTGFGASNSSFGASSVQSATSPSFTAYRK